jgi:hypothetical protein
MKLSSWDLSKLNGSIPALNLNEKIPPGADKSTPVILIMPVYKEPLDVDREYTCSEIGFS